MTTERTEDLTDYYRNITTVRNDRERRGSVSHRTSISCQSFL